MRGEFLQSSPQSASQPRLPESWKPVWSLSPRGPDWMPITPKTGSLFHAETHAVPARTRTAPFAHFRRGIGPRRVWVGAPWYGGHADGDFGVALFWRGVCF